MLTLARLLSLRHLRMQWLRALAAMVGVVMGVTAFVFVPTIGANLQESMNVTTSDLSGNAPIEIRSAEDGIPIAQLDTIQAQAGIEVIAPLSTGGGFLVGESELLLFVGINASLDQTVRTYALVSGDWLSQRGQLLISQAYATEKNIHVGDTVSLVSSGGVHSYQVVGLLDGNTGVMRLNDGDVMVMSLEDAFQLRGAALVDTISVIPTSGTTSDVLITQLDRTLDDTMVVGTPSDRVQAAQSFLVVVNALLLVVSSLILASGSSLIYSTVSISIAQRRSEIGILRSLGMAKEQVRFLYIAESAVLGFVGSLLGLVTGYLMVRVGSRLQLIPEDFIGSSMLRSQAEMIVPTWVPLVAVTMGTLIPVLAGYFASRPTLEIDPIEALTQIRAEIGALRFNKTRFAMGIAITSLVILIRVFFQGELMLAVLIGNIGVMSMVLAAFLLYVPMMALLARVSSSVLARFGAVGMVTTTNITRRPKRVLTVGMLLLLGVLMGVFIGQSNLGYTEFIAMWDSGENIADLTITGVGANPFKPLVAIPSSVIQQIRTNPHIDQTLSESLNEFEQNGVKYIVRATDIRTFRVMGGAFGWQSGDETTAYDRLQNADKPSILIGAGFVAIQNNFVTNRSVTLMTPKGEVAFEVVGTILGGINTEAVQVFMDSVTYQRYWQDSAVDRLLVTLVPTADVQTVRRDFLKEFALDGVVTYDGNEMKASFIRRIASISNVSSLLTNLFVIIILVGLMSTFYVFVIDRRREIGLLRAIGFQRSQIALGILMEGALLFAIAVMLGLPCALVANLLQQMAMQNLMGILFQVNPRELVFILLFSLGVVLLATLVPAQIAGRTNILEAMRYE